MKPTVHHSCCTCWESFMKRLAALIMAIVATLTISTVPPASAESSNGDLSLELRSYCFNGAPFVAAWVEGVGVVSAAPDPILVGKVLPASEHWAVSPGRVRVDLTITTDAGAESLSGVVMVVSCERLGPKPADDRFKQHKRSCKHEAKKWTRIVWVHHVEAVSGRGDRYWEQYLDIGPWVRVETPRGCWLRRQEVKEREERRERRHRGEARGARVNR